MRGFVLAVWLLLFAAGSADAAPIIVYAIMTYLGAMTLAQFIIAVVVYGISQYQRKKAARRARDAYNASLQDRLAMTPIANGPRMRVYGRVRVGGGVVFKWSHGTSNEVYTLLISLAGHQVQGIVDVYAADNKLTLDANGWVLNEPYLRRDSTSGVTTSVANPSGVASFNLPENYVIGTLHCIAPAGDSSDAGVYSPEITLADGVATVSVIAGYVVEWSYQYLATKTLVRVRKFLGGPSQDLHTYLADHPDIAATDKFAGDACLLVDMYYSQDAFPTGVPAFSAVVDGALVFDPRSNTTAWTQNPALIARDWALYANGGGLQASQLNEDSFIVAANACDVSHTFSVSGQPVVDKIYRCGIAMPLEGQPTGWLDEICESMAGAHAWPGGRLAVVAGHWRAPVASINESWLAGTGDINIIPEPGIDQVANSITPFIADEARQYLEQQIPAVAPAAYLAADGQEFGRELQMMGVQTPYHAQHIAGVMLRGERMSGTIVLHCKFIAFQLDVFDVVTMYIEEFGYTGQTFEVQDTVLTMDGGVQLTLRRTAASVYDPDAAFTLPTFAERTSLPDPTVVAQVQGLVVSSGTAPLSDGSILVRTAVGWAAMADAGVTVGGSIELQYVEMGASGAVVGSDNWASWLEPGGSTGAVMPGLRSGVAYVFRARGINGAGVRGPWSTQEVHIVAGVPVASLRAELSLPAAVVQASAAGVVGSFAGAAGELRVYSNTTRLTAGVVYSVASATGCTVSINSAGAYSVGAMSADAATATLRAVVLGKTFDLPFTLTKAKQGVDGAGNITWTTRGGVVMVGSIASKPTGTDAWNGEAATSQGFAGGCYVAFTAQGAGTFMCGLNADPTTQPDFQTIDYAWTCDIAGNCAIYESGTYISGHGAYDSGTRFEVRHSAGFVTYYKNSFAVRSTPLADSAVLYADTSLYHTGTVVNNLVFGPIGARGAQGDAGPAGYSSATVTIYKRSATTPNGPTADVTYTFATKALSGLDGGWSTAWPAGSDPVWARVASFSSTAATDTAAAGEWTAAQMVAQNGADGDDGSNGLNVATVYLYQRTSSATAPALPSADVTFTFAGGAISGANNGWLASLPATGGAYRWVTQATAASTSATDTLPPSEWAEAGLIAQDGSDGADALVFELSSESVTLSATSAGFVTSYAGVSTTITAKRGAVVESGWSYSKADSAGLTTSISGNVIAVTAMSDSSDKEYVDITPSKAGQPTQQPKRFDVTKTRSAVGTSGPLSGWYVGAYASDFTSPYSMTATVTFATNGALQATATNQATQNGYWYAPSTSGIGSSYWIKVTKLSGYDPTGGALGTWLQLSSDRSFTLSGSTNALGQYAVKIATSASDSAIVGSGFFDLGCDNGV